MGPQFFGSRSHIVDLGCIMQNSMKPCSAFDKFAEHGWTPLPDLYRLTPVTLVFIDVHDVLRYQWIKHDTGFCQSQTKALLLTASVGNLFNDRPSVPCLH